MFSFITVWMQLNSMESNHTIKLQSAGRSRYLSHYPLVGTHQMQHSQTLTSLHLQDLMSRIHTSPRMLPSFHPPLIKSWGWSPPNPRHTAAWSCLPTGQGSPLSPSTLLQCCKKRLPLLIADGAQLAKSTWFSSVPLDVGNIVYIKIHLAESADIIWRAYYYFCIMSQ